MAKMVSSYAVYELVVHVSSVECVLEEVFETAVLWEAKC